MVSKNHWSVLCSQCATSYTEVVVGGWRQHSWSRARAWCEFSATAGRCDEVKIRAALGGRVAINARLRIAERWGEASALPLRRGHCHLQCGQTTTAVCIWPPHLCSPTMAWLLLQLCP